MRILKGDGTQNLMIPPVLNFQVLISSGRVLGNPAKMRTLNLS
jgi:hypothetical protein